MKLFKKLDNYLLHYYPTIWITRVHYFLPIGLSAALLLFIITISIGWNLKNELPDNIVPIVLMIVPVLIYLIYWFVFQSRYNVAKSGGKMPLSFEYLNFFSYLLVFLMAFLIISAIPLANYQKVRNAINTEELNADLEKLNKGNALVNYSSEIIFQINGSVSYYPSSFTYTDYYFDYDYYPDEYYNTTPAQITVSRNQAVQFIQDYIEAFNKYARYPITKSAGEILAEREDGSYSYGPYEGYDYDHTWEVQNKLSIIKGKIQHGWYDEYSSSWFWKIVLGIMAFAALLIWIFKQMKLRQFVFGFISICLTPLFAAIIGVILFELIGINGEEEEVISGLILIIYLLFVFISIRAFRSPTLNNSGYVISMYLNFFTPLLPLFLWLFFIYEREPYYYSYNADATSTMNLLYWSGWIFGLGSIVLFKPLYSKFRSLPSKN